MTILTLNKVCSICNEVKETNLFYRDASSKDGFAAQCKVCRNKKSIAYAKNRKKIDPKFRQKALKSSSNSRRKTRYGVDQIKFDTFLELQNYSCAICKTHRNNLNRDLCVDHCHITGKFRGLLCDDCNLGLGKFKDNINSIQAILEYLK